MSQASVLALLNGKKPQRYGQILMQVWFKRRQNKVRLGKNQEKSGENDENQLLISGDFQSGEKVKTRRLLIKSGGLAVLALPGKIWESYSLSPRASKTASNSVFSPL
ncbi:hypothetical protein I4U23_027479 [Adineta vaga]|nr:hypothetical protein I4U23_027479 [Adineta vaga]